MVHSFFGATVISFSLIIIKDSDTSFSCPAKIEAFFVVSPISTLNPARAIDRFFAVLSAFAKSFS